MTWQDQQTPWGKKPSSPEEMIAAFLKKLKDGFSGSSQPSSDRGENEGTGSPLGGIGKLVGIIVAIFVIQIVYSSFYTIQPGEVGVVLRFGKHAKTTNPGLNFKIPMIEDVIKVNMEAVRKEEFGFRTSLPGRQTMYEKRNYEEESLMLSADKNVINVQWIVQYKIQDPVRFLFKVRNVPQAVRDVSETVMRRIIGNMDFDYVLGNREIVVATAKDEMQETLNRIGAGVKMGTIQLQDINPPDLVKPAFNEVNEADQDMKRLVNEAEETYNRLVPKARGSAKKIIQEAEGYAAERINTAQGETSRFTDILAEYTTAKEVTRRRMYLETVQQTLPRVKEIYIMDTNKGGVLPLLNLRSQDLPAVKTQ